MSNTLSNKVEFGNDSMANVKIFEFDNNLARMSVITEDQTAATKLRV